MYKEVVSMEEPQEIEEGLDTVYIRKNIQKVEVAGEDGTQSVEYHYLEREFPLKEWEIQKAVMKHDSELAVIEEAVAELATLMTKEEA